MPSLALPNAGLLDILTLADDGDPPPSWARAWAETIAVHAHVAVRPRRNLWAMRLDEAVRRAEQPAVIAAYGVGCFALAWWARLSPASYVERVAGALLVRPFSATVTAALQGARDYAGPKTLFPFASIVIGDGEDDARTHALAQRWGSDFVGFDGFDREEKGLGSRALKIGTGLIERVIAARSSPAAKPGFSAPNERSDCPTAML